MTTGFYWICSIVVFVGLSQPASHPLDKLNENNHMSDKPDTPLKAKYHDYSHDYAARQKTSSGNISYDGYQIHHIMVRNASDADQLKQLKKYNKFDFWCEIIIGKNVDVLTSPENVAELKQWLMKRGMDSFVKIYDIGPLTKVKKKSADDYSFYQMDWADYHPLEVIYHWLKKLEATCDFCELEHIGRSNEGEDMIVIKVCRRGCGNKPAIWIDSGIHAREWISPATGTWILNELVTNDANHPQLTQNLDWYFLPMINPDGYRRTRNGDRLWRKTTTRYHGDNCMGTDLNRNWNFHWGEKPGSDKNSCSDAYHGPEPFSEVESRNVRDFILKHNQNHNIKLYLSLHSYRQQILSTYGYSKNPPPGKEAIESLGRRGAAAMKALHGMIYEVGCSPCVNDNPTMGTSKDWALEIAGIPYSYTLELRDLGNFGFLLPANQIIPTAEEVWAFIKLAGNQISTEFAQGNANGNGDNSDTGDNTEAQSNANGNGDNSDNGNNGNSNGYGNSHLYYRDKYRNRYKRNMYRNRYKDFEKYRYDTEAQSNANGNGDNSDNGKNGNSNGYGNSHLYYRDKYRNRYKRNMYRNRYKDFEKYRYDTEGQTIDNGNGNHTDNGYNGNGIGYENSYLYYRNMYRNRYKNSRKWWRVLLSSRFANSNNFN